MTACRQPLFLLLLFCSPSLLMAQQFRTPTLSPFSEIRQEIGLTELTLSYSRPSAKGRTVYGELVPYGEIWRTGANVSTNLTVEEDVKVAGNELVAGTYALYSIPGPTEWTIIVHTKTGMRSIAGGRVKPENDVFRFTVVPEYLPKYVETLSMQFVSLSSSRCELQISWEHTRVAFPIEVEVASKIEAQLAERLTSEEGISDRIYFRAAEYYLNNDGDLDKSLDWINKALERSPQNYRYGLLKAKIYASRGDTATAIRTVETANAWARAADNANYTKQTTDYRATLSPIPAATPYAEDVASLDAILAALYEVISGDQNEVRDWDRFQYLFVPEARLIPSGPGNTGRIGYRIWSPQEYIDFAGRRLEEMGFFEKELHREVAEYGSLVHVFSTYESFRSATDTEPFSRGINSIQLLNDGQRWWIMQIYWRSESTDLPLPKAYLPQE